MKNGPGKLRRSALQFPANRWHVRPQMKKREDNKASTWRTAIAIIAACHVVLLLGALATYFWITGLCGTVAFIGLARALQVLPDLWTSTRNKIGVSLWMIGVAIALFHTVPVMKYIITWHAWHAA